ncbi:hypothetical protein ABNM01_22890 [Pseudomonas syringae]
MTTCIIAIVLLIIIYPKLSRAVKRDGFSKVFTARRLFKTAGAFFLVGVGLGFVNIAARAGAVSGSGVPDDSRSLLDTMELTSIISLCIALALTVLSVLKSLMQKYQAR